MQKPAGPVGGPRDGPSPRRRRRDIGRREPQAQARRPAPRRLWIIAGLAGAGAIAAVVAIWHLPARMYPGSSDGAVQARAALQGGLLTAAAALTAVAGALIALDETRQANAETKAANVNTHVRELNVEAVKLLNEPDNLGIRLGGLYALERLATDSPDDQRTVVEVLSAFVRTRSTDPALRPPPPATEVAAGSAADTWLDGANLTRARLDGANLTGTHLVGANLTDAWLGGANLTDALLHGANLTDAGGLTQGQVDVTYGDAGTRLPAELVRPAWWPPAAS